MNRDFVPAVVMTAIAIGLYPDISFGGMPWTKSLLIELVNKAIKIDTAGRRIAQLEANSLTPQQRQAIVEHAKASPGGPHQIIIASDASCMDCVSYARAFEQALNDAGWLVRFKTLAGAGAGSSLGRVSLMVRDVASPPPEAIMLQQALNSAGIDVDLIRSERDFHDFPNDRRPILYLAAIPRQR